MKTLAFSSEFKQRYQESKLKVKGNKRVDSVIAYKHKLEKETIKQKKRKKLKKLQTKEPEMIEYDGDHPHTILSEFKNAPSCSINLNEHHQISNSSNQAMSDCSSLTCSIMTYATSHESSCNVFIISCGKTDDKDEWLFLIVGNYFRYKNSFLQIESYICEGEERSFPLRFSFIHYAMIKVELEAASDALIAKSIVTSPLVLPSILQTNSSHVGKLSGLLVGIATSKEQVKAVTSAMSVLYTFCDAAENVSADMSPAENLMVLEYDSNSASEMIVFKVILKMARTRLNVANL